MKNKLRKLLLADIRPEEKIKLYEENKAFFDKLLSGHKEDLEFAVFHKLYSYATVLCEVHEYEKAYAVSIELDNNIKGLKGTSKKHVQFEKDNTLTKAVCLSELNKYEESNAVLSKLLIKNKHDKSLALFYRNNLIGQTEKLLKWPIKISGFFLILFLINNYLHYIQISRWIRHLATITFILLLACEFLYPRFYTKWKIRSS